MSISARVIPEVDIFRLWPPEAGFKKNRKQAIWVFESQRDYEKSQYIDPDTFHIFVKKGNRSMQKNFLTQSQLFPAIKFSSIIQGSTDLQAC